MAERSTLGQLLEQIRKADLDADRELMFARSADTEVDQEAALKHFREAAAERSRAEALLVKELRARGAKKWRKK